MALLGRSCFPDTNSGKYAFYPSKSCFWLANITGTKVSKLEFVFEPVGVTRPDMIERGRRKKQIHNVTKARLDLMIGTSKAIERDDSDSDSDSDEELLFKYEKDQPAGAILKFVANKYLEVYGTDNRRVS